MAGNYWIKFYIEAVDDPKMATLPDRLWRRFYELCLIAGKQNKGGLLPPIEQIAWLLRMNVKTLCKDLQGLIELNLIHETEEGLIVTNFSKRQEKVGVNERVQKFRDEKKKEQYYGNENVTEVKLKVTQITDTDTDTDTESDSGGASVLSPIQVSLEKITGLPPSSADDVKAMDEIAEMQPIQEDIESAFNWIQAQGKKVLRYRSMVNPIRVSIAKRVQKPRNSNSSILERNKEVITKLLAEAEVIDV